MNLSERPSRIVRDSASWQPMRMAALTDLARRPGSAGAGEGKRRGDDRNDMDVRIAAAFADGVAEGRFQAEAEAQAREQALGRDARQRWDGLLEHLAAGIAEIESGMADRLLDLSAILAARIACREIAGSEQAIRPVLAEALALITGTARQLEVIAHPDDCQAVETWLGSACGDASLTVRADASMTPGGCLLRADDSVLDATLRTRVIRALAAVGIDGTEAGSIADAALSKDPDPPEAA